MTDPTGAPAAPMPIAPADWQRNENAVRDTLDLIATTFKDQLALAERKRAEFMAMIDAMKLQHGVAAPPAQTEAERREAMFDTRWSTAVTPERQKLMDQEGERVAALTPHERKMHADDLRKSLGADYDRIVADARKAYPGELPETVIASRFNLLNLAALGRHKAAYNAARRAAGLPVE